MTNAGLATRCPACGTAFRVVPDQLRVSDGWVRCGRCAEVFNAAESLIDAESGAPRRAPEPQGAAGPAASAAGVPAPAYRPPESAVPDAAGMDVDIEFDPVVAASEPSPSRFAEDEVEPGTWAVPPPAGTSIERATDLLTSRPAERPTDRSSERPAERADPPFESASDAEPGAVAASKPAAAAPERREKTNKPIRKQSQPITPSFMRQAERAERWRRPGVRAALAGVLLLGLIGLLAQFAYTWRDLLAARYAASKPVFEQACGLLGCKVEAPHLIENLVVESSGLVRVERSNVYKLSVSLRNRAGIETAVPGLDLTLSDAQGRTVARRVLRATDLGASQASLGAGRELALRATLQAATDPVAGYTIEIFYP